MDNNLINEDFKSNDGIKDKNAKNAAILLKNQKEIAKRLDKDKEDSIDKFPQPNKLDLTKSPYTESQKV
jgi:hypothetical protein